MAGLVPSARASARIVGSVSPLVSASSWIAASALRAISAAVEPVIWYRPRSNMTSYYNKSPTEAAESPGARTTVRRRAGRGRYDGKTIAAILDEGLIGHAGFIVGGQPYAIPMLYAHADDRLYLHGSPLSRILGSLAGGAPVCFTVTLVDGLVLARSAFHHSINYRSVVVLGQARVLRARTEKLAALRAIVEHVSPGRSGEARGPSQQELSATEVVVLAIEEASAKLRAGPPVDAPEDYALPVWAGELPLGLAVGAPRTDPRCTEPVPAYVRTYHREHGHGEAAQAAR